MWSNYKNRYFCGKAIINTSLHIQKADEEFHRFAGEIALYSMNNIVHPADLVKLEIGMQELKNTSMNFTALRMLKNDGEYKWMLVSLSYDSETIGNQRLISFEMQDITTLNHELQELKAHTQTYGEYLGLMDYLMLSYDMDTDKLKIFMIESQQINFYQGALTDWKQEKLFHGDIDANDMDVFENFCDSMKNGDKSFEYEMHIALIGKDKAMECCLIKGKTIIGEMGKRHVIAAISKINSITKKREVNLEVETATDAGTGLLNKKTITKYAIDLLKSKPDRNVFFVVMDLDNFKYVNDTFGHMFGDEVLFKVAEIVKQAVGDYGVAGRIGGDEFFVVLDNKIHNEQELRGILRTIRSNIEWAYKDSIKLSCSIGCACYPQDAHHYPELFDIADKALYIAKEKGKNRYIIYEKDLHQRYIKGEGKVILREKDLYQYNKIGLVKQVLSEFLHKRTMSIEEMCESILLCFELEDISIFMGENRERTICWGIFKEAELRNDYFEKEDYIRNFDDNNIFIIDNLNFLQGKSDAAYEAFMKDKISASIQYLIGTKEHPQGFITFNKSKLSKKWTEIDIHYLSFLGKVIEIGLFGDAG